MDDRVDLHMGELKQKRGFLRPGGFPSHHRLFRYQNGRMTWFWGTPILGTSTYPIQNHEHHLKKVCLYLLIDSIAGNVSRYAAVDSWKKLLRRLPSQFFHHSKPQVLQLRLRSLHMSSSLHGFQLPLPHFIPISDTIEYPIHWSHLPRTATIAP